MAAVLVILFPKLKANPPAAPDDDVAAVAETGAETLKLLLRRLTSTGLGWLEMAFWSGNISNILLSLFL